MLRSSSVTVLLVLLALPVLATSITGTAGPPPATYTIDPDASEVLIHVGKNGVFSFMGHTHEVVAPVGGGTIVLQSDDLAQSQVRVEFEAAALRITGKGEPAADVPEVQRTMESDRVLDVERFARITFVSRSIRVVERKGNRLRLSVTGDLTLHGVTSSLTTEVVSDVAPDRLTASGTLTVRQTAFGIEPVTAGAGTVRVKDGVDVRFTFVARSTH
jgi:polyisoprenoid-binding protein YceI